MAQMTQVFRKVTIIGLGLIGGSLAAGLKRQRVAKEVMGVSRKTSTLAYALRNRIVDRATPDLKRGIDNADLVIMASPVKTILETIKTIGPHLKRGCIVSDVGSTKESIVDVAQTDLPSHVFFVGAHPLAGSEKSGIHHANPELFQGALCLLTPTDKTNREALGKVKEVWERMGSSVKTVSPGDHDKYLAFVSHLPHVIAYALVGSIPSESLAYAGKGLKDLTRIAASDPTLWTDICLENAKNLVQSIDDFTKNLAGLRKAIVSKNEKNLLENLQKSKQIRDAIDRSV